MSTKSYHSPINYSLRSNTFTYRILDKLYSTKDAVYNNHKGQYEYLHILPSGCEITIIWTKKHEI